MNSDKTRNYLIMYKDQVGYEHNGVWTGKNLSAIREQFISELGEHNQILSIREV